RKYTAMKSAFAYRWGYRRREYEASERSPKVQLIPEERILGRAAWKFIGRSTLPLLVARIGADHVDLAVAAEDLAVLADSLHTRSDFHQQSIAWCDDQPRRRPSSWFLKMFFIAAGAEFSHYNLRPANSQEWIGQGCARDSLAPERGMPRAGGRGHGLSL